MQNNFGKEWMDKLRNKYVVDWASHKLASDFGSSSMGFVSPKVIRRWAIDNNIESYLPAAYK